MMMKIRKSFKFEASHQLVHHDGKCRRLHGHSYTFVLEVVGPLIKEGPKQNMVLDYTDLGIAGKAVEKMLDHQHLNDIIDPEMPTAELIAAFIFDHVMTTIPTLWAVEVSETLSTASRFCPAEHAYASEWMNEMKGEHNLAEKMLSSPSIRTALDVYEEETKQEEA